MEAVVDDEVVYIKKYRTVIGGDINFEFDVTTDKTSVRELKHVLRQFNMKLFNSMPTRGLACLDDVFIHFYPEYHSTRISTDFIFSDYKSVSLNYNNDIM